MQHNTLGLIHDFLTRTVKPGDFCIDATAGKGRDTALLAHLAGENGRVLSFDIQPSAMEQTKDLLDRHGLSAELILRSHEWMEDYARPETVDCIVFNLGRLPGGDPRIFTHGKSSVAAMEAGLRLLKKGGVMTLGIYYGGENGTEERDAVLSFLEQLDPKEYSVLLGSWPNRKGDPPLPVFIWKE